MKLSEIKPIFQIEISENTLSGPHITTDVCNDFKLSQYLKGIIKHPQAIISVTISIGYPRITCKGNEATRQNFHYFYKYNQGDSLKTLNELCAE